MDFKELQQEIDRYMQMLPTHHTKIHEAEDLASEFLKIQHVISNVMLQLEFDMSEVRSVGKMYYNNALIKSSAKNATEKKAEADADQEYSHADKTERNLKAQIQYLKVKLSIFNDAHLCCRNLSKEK